MNNPQMGFYLVDNSAMNKQTDLKTIVAENLTRLMADHITLNTIEKVAIRSGVGRGTVDRVKKGEVSTSLDTIERLAQAFDIDPVDLVLIQTEDGAADQKKNAPQNFAKEAIIILSVYAGASSKERLGILRFVMGVGGLDTSGMDFSGITTPAGDKP